MRTSRHTWDTGGIFDLDVYVRDCRALYRRRQSFEWDGLGEATDYSWGGCEVCGADEPGRNVLGLPQLVKLFAGARMYSETPAGGPNWGLRATFTLPCPR